MLQSRIFCSRFSKKQRTLLCDDTQVLAVDDNQHSQRPIKSSQTLNESSTWSLSDNESVYSKQKGSSTVTLITGSASSPISKRLRLIPNPNPQPTPMFHNDDNDDYTNSTTTTNNSPIPFLSSFPAGCQLEVNPSDDAADDSFTPPPLSPHSSVDVFHTNAAMGACCKEQDDTSLFGDNGWNVSLGVEKVRRPCRSDKPPFVVPKTMGTLSMGRNTIVDEEEKVNNHAKKLFPIFSDKDYQEEIHFGSEEDLRDLKDLVDTGTMTMKSFGNTREFEAKIKTKKLLLTDIFTEEHCQLVWIANQEIPYHRDEQFKEVVDKAKEFKCWFKEVSDMFLENGYPTVVAEILTDTFTDEVKRNDDDADDDDDGMVSEILSKFDDYSESSSLCSMYDKLESIEGVVEELECTCSEAYLTILKLGDANYLRRLLQNRVKNIPEIDEHLFYGIQKLVNRLQRMLDNNHKPKLTARAGRVLKEGYNALEWHSNIHKMYERYGYTADSIRQLNKAVEKDIMV